MKKKILLLLILVASIFSITACDKNKSSIIFKKEYESLNGVTNANGKEHRTLNIPKHNPFIITDAKDIVKKIENEDTFYVYFGSKLCPWCRSTIEKAIEVANDKSIDKIYYVEAWNDEGEEILRDKYILDENNTPVQVNEGTEEYHKLLEYLAEILPDYTITTKDNEEINIGEKRIYLPQYIYIAKGKPIRITDGISSLQVGSRDELTEEILAEEEEIYDNFFINTCDESC